MTVRLAATHPHVGKVIQEEWQGIVDVLAEFMNATTALIMQFNLDTNLLSVVVGNNGDNSPFPQGWIEKCSSSHSYFEHVINSGKRLFVLNALESDVYKTLELEHKLINYLGLPIHWPNGDIFGIICVLHTKARHYSDKQEHLIIQLRNMIETQLELLEKNLALETLSKELQYLANTDDLTGSWNRRAFINESEKELNRARRNNHHCCLLMMDIDNFKNINDRFGHDIGDEVLRLFTHCIRASKRRYDIFGRIGGEEFAVLLPETKRSEAIEQAERIRKKVSDIFFYTNGQQVQITVSIGVCELSQNGLSFHAGLGCADKMLYEAKRAGKNRVYAV